MEQKSNGKEGEARGGCLPFLLFVLLGIPLVIGAIIFIPAIFESTGYCISKGRWLSDEEFLEAAIKEERNNKWMEISDFMSTEGFLKENPQCCSVEKITLRKMGRGLGEFLERSLLYSVYVRVTVEYKLNKSAQMMMGEGRYEYYEAIYDLTSCGGRSNWAGMSITKANSHYNTRK